MPESLFRFPRERFWWTARKYNAWDQFTDEDFTPTTVSATVTDEVLPGVAQTATETTWACARCHGTGAQKVGDR